MRNKRERNAIYGACPMLPNSRIRHGESCSAYEGVIENTPDLAPCIPGTQVCPSTGRRRILVTVQLDVVPRARIRCIPGDNMLQCLADVIWSILIGGFFSSTFRDSKPAGSTITVGQQKRVRYSSVVSIRQIFKF